MQGPARAVSTVLSMSQSTGDRQARKWGKPGRAGRAARAKGPKGVHCHEGERSGPAGQGSRVERAIRECLDLKPSNSSQISLPLSPLVATEIGRNAKLYERGRGKDNREPLTGFLVQAETRLGCPALAFCEWQTSLASEAAARQ